MLQGNGDNLFNFLSSILAAIAIFLLALYKDNRTNKRIDAVEAWLSKVEESSMVGLKEVTELQTAHTKMIIKDYPDTEAMKEALKPISEKLEELKNIIDDGQKKYIRELEKDNRELKLKNK